MRERRLLLKCCLKISRPDDSYGLTNGCMVEPWLGHGLMTAPGGARCRILRPGGIPNGFGCLNSATRLFQQAQDKENFRDRLATYPNFS
ncbi:MAG: hypothetical protein Udaeo2_11990 [Candidatus Udaeobacter sp.]|nr:MAG: hypothetical protein Udaeo2_11990 [Candidatus Udaeobacter sp.]